MRCMQPHWPQHAFSRDPDARSVMKNMRDSDAPDVLSITSPSSYLPFSSLVFVSILLFNIVCGYSLASSEAEPSFAASMASCIPVCVVFAAATIRRPPSLDASYRTAVLCIIAGLLCAPFALPALQDQTGEQAYIALLSAGPICSICWRTA